MSFAVMKLAAAATITSTVMVASPAPACAAEPADNYNGPIQGRAYECIKPRNPNSPIKMWAADGSDTGIRFNDAKWNGSRCARKPGTLRISQFPPLQINGTPMAMVRGAGGSTAQDNEAIRHGHVRIDDLSKLPTLIQPTWPNGRPCANETSTLYYNNPQGTAPIPEEFQYKPRQQSSDWNNYGDPVQTDGTFHPPGVHYNYILLSWLTTSNGKRNPGGGQPRAVIMKNDRIRRCNVEPIISRAYAPGSRKVIGYVRGLYGRIRTNSGDTATGWFAHSWRWKGSKQWNYLVSTTRVP